jgi:hypothetical protein
VAKGDREPHSPHVIVVFLRKNGSWRLPAPHCRENAESPALFFLGGVRIVDFHTFWAEKGGGGTNGTTVKQLLDELTLRWPAEA